MLENTANFARRMLIYVKTLIMFSASTSLWLYFPKISLFQQNFRVKIALFLCQDGVVFLVYPRPNRVTETLEAIRSLVIMGPRRNFALNITIRLVS